MVSSELGALILQESSGYSTATCKDPQHGTPPWGIALLRSPFCAGSPFSGGATVDCDDTAGLLRRIFRHARGKT